MTRVRAVVLEQKVGIRDLESPDAVTDLPCGLMPCDVVLLILVVAAASD